MEKNKVKYLVKVAMLAALASVVMTFEILIPFTPTFLKLDLSEVVVLIGGFSLGPLAAVLIELVKNLVHVTSSITGGIGELANFIIGCSFVLPAAILYKKRKTVKSALLGLVVGSLVMVVAAAIANYFVMIPLYVEIFAGQYNITGQQSLDKIVSMGNNKLINNLPTLILFGVVPFNIFKVVVVSILTFLTYKKVSPILHK